MCLMRMGPVGKVITTWKRVRVAKMKGPLEAGFFLHMDGWMRDNSGH